MPAGAELYISYIAGEGWAGLAGRCGVDRGVPAHGTCATGGA